MKVFASLPLLASFLALDGCTLAATAASSHNSPLLSGKRHALELNANGAGGGAHALQKRELVQRAASVLNERRKFGGFGGFGGGNNGGGGGAASSTTTTAGAVTTTTSAAAAAATVDATGQGAALLDTGPSANDTDPQTSLTLDPSQVAAGLAQDGQQTPEAGQVASATSTNNFINFCLLRTDLPLTNGQQVKTGSCNGVPMGVIGAQSTMPSAKFVNPPNLGTIPANQNFTIQMKINNLATGNFVNAESNYFSAPQNTDANGVIIGHSHVVIESIDSLGSTTVTNPQQFAFFKGLNDPAVNGVLSTDVAGGLPAGTYKMSSINTAANHQPALVAVAQHGSLDDAVYFTVADNAAGTAATTTAGSIAADVATTTAAASSTAETTAAATTTTSAAQGDGGNGFGQGGFGKGFGKGFVKRHADAQPQQQQQPQKRSLLQRRLEALELLELA
ncbi:hypothetical protein JCM5296_003863 [Sporobolomyces johnsonii]